MDEHEHVLRNASDLQLSPSTFGSYNYAPQLADTSYQQYIVKTEDYDNHSVPQWIGYQQMAPYCDSTRIGCGFIPDEYVLSMGANQVTYSRLQHEEVPLNNYISTQHELFHCQGQKQGPDEGLDNASQHQPNMKRRRSYSREKATDTDRRRRTRIPAALDALEDLLPHSKEGNKTNIVDDCIDYIKDLQLQMKELSQNRLGGEPTSNHLTFLQGYGHYLVHGNTATGPVQDMLGKLLEMNPSAATKLLESKGLFMIAVSPN